jgi:hypothetical protein
VSELVKIRQLQVGFAPLTPTRGFAPGPHWGKAPRPQYRLALRASHECCPPTFQIVDTPLLLETISAKYAVDLQLWQTAVSPSNELHLEYNPAKITRVSFC